jgi:hypothetical protein
MKNLTPSNKASGCKNATDGMSYTTAVYHQQLQTTNNLNNKEMQKTIGFHLPRRNMQHECWGDINIFPVLWHLFCRSLSIHLS